MKTLKSNLLILIISSSVLSALWSNGQEATTTFQTMAIAHLDEKIEPNQNIVFASSFLAAWNELKVIIGDDICTKEPVSLVPQLNKQAGLFQGSDDFVALAGFVKDGIIEQINGALEAKYGFVNPYLKNYSDRYDNIICYAGFREKISFRHPFLKHSSPYPFFYNGKYAHVKCFGISNADSMLKDLEKICRQVEIYDYKDCNDFIVKLKGKATDSELILAKIPLGKTMNQTIRDVQNRIAHTQPRQLTGGELLVIPCINLFTENNFEELTGKYLANKGFEQYFFAVAGQTLNFSLDETGASTISQSVIVLKKGPNEGKYIFDRPFLVYMKKKNAELPYFAVWISNPEFLEKY
ncbi:MAG: hypothetical protein KKA81_10820 [Bacteroidetes bacterium]|nr:hypothetical protein [Bacteroidota bacterium]